MQPLAFAEVDGLKALYDILCVAPATAEFMAETLQARWQDDALLVCSMQEGVADIVGTLHATLLSVWKLLQFTDSRFLSVGSAARGYTARVFVGLNNFADFMKEDKRNSLWSSKVRREHSL